MPAGPPVTHDPAASSGRAAFADHVAAADRGSWVKNVVVPLLVAAASLFLISGIVGAVTYIALGVPDDDEGIATPAATISMIVSVLLTLWLMTKASRLTLADLGWSRRGALSGWVKGALGGIAAITVVWLANVAFGGVSLTTRWTDATAGAIAISVVFFLFQGPYEEIVLRCYLLPHFTTRMGLTAALVVTSLLFTVLHGANPNTTPMGFVNLFVFGMAFAAVYVRTGNAWLIGAGHSTWNFFLGDFFGSNVSGNPVFQSVFRSSPVTGEELLSGGIYGMEGSIVATLIGIGVVVWGLRGAPSAR